MSDFAQTCERFHVLTAEQLAELQQGDVSDPQAMARQLIERGWLTAFQANLLLQGRGQELVLGSYVLLDKLGEGGMGAVYRARNWKLGRIAAVKLIRKERLTGPDAVRRFYREIRAAAQLDHPNVVRAYDADEVNGVHFFAMEYVEGVDLSHLVRDHGRLPIALACEYIRQAALGLQHAHERGLVHRDIKPANLLLACGQGIGTIKVLDMGLARQDETECSERSATLTQIGTVMGTPDFMAPEQSVSSHTVDIRADLYSLGCSLYYLLTGTLPFPGGSLTEKLLKHQLEQPAPIESLRPEVPESVSALVHKLLAKKREERLQTPAELATALDAILKDSALWETRASATSTAFSARRLPANTLWEEIVAAGAGQKSIRRRFPNVLRWAGIAAAVAAMLFGMVLLGSLIGTGRSPPRDEKTKKAQVDDTALLQIPVRRTINAHKGSIMSMALSPDGKTLVTGGHDRTARAWNPATGEARWAIVGRLHEVSSLVFSADGSKLGMGMVWTQSAELIDPQNGARLGGFGHAARVNQVALSPDAKHMAVGAWDQRIILWETPTVFSPKKRKGERHDLRYLSSPAEQAAFTPDGKLLASVVGKSLKLWDVETATETAAIEMNGLRGRLGFCPDGKLLVMASRFQEVEFRFLEVPALTVSATVALHGSGGYRCWAFSPDMRLVAACLTDGTTTLWDTSTGDMQATFAAPKGTVSELCVAQDGKMIAAATHEGQVHLWVR